jgi:hypothetical protein
VTGLVYLAIIALWAAFLIPWLRRHRDELHGRRSADRYQRAMDTLAKASDDQHDDDYEPEDELPADDVGAGSNTLPTPQQALAIVSGLLGRTGSSGRAVRRRRRVLAVLGAGFAAAVAGTLAGYLPGVAPAAFAGLLVVYVTVLLRTAASPAAESRAAAGDADELRAEARRAQRQAQALLRARQSASGDESGRWDAVPTTLPTYVTKPKAAKVPRVVDLTAPARGTAGEAMVARAQQERDRARKSAAQRQFEQEIAAVEPDSLQEVAELVSPPEREEYRQPYRRAANG